MCSGCADKNFMCTKWQFYWACWKTYENKTNSRALNVHFNKLAMLNTDALHWWLAYTFLYLERWSLYWTRPLFCGEFCLFCHGYMHQWWHLLGHIVHRVYELIIHIWKICHVVFTWKMIQSGHNFAHTTAAELLWYVQICDLIKSLELELQQR